MKIRIFTSAFLMLMGVSLGQEALKFQLVNQFPGYGAGIDSISLSSDLHILASASQSRTIRAWDTQLGTEKYNFQVFGAYAQVSFSQKGEFLAVGLSTREVEIHDGSTGKLLQNIRQLPDFVLDTAFSPDSKHLAITSGDNLYIWDLQKRFFAKTVNLPGGFTTSIAYSNKGNSIAVASEKGNIYLVNPQNGEITKTLRGHTGIVRSVNFNNASTKLVSCGDDSALILWDASSFTQIAFKKIEKGCNRGLSFSPNDELIYIGLQKNVTVFRSESLTPLGSFSLTKTTVSDLEISSDSKSLFTADTSETYDDTENKISHWGITSSP
jgi:WD40 repeat protein